MYNCAASESFQKLDFSCHEKILRSLKAPELARLASGLAQATLAIYLATLKPQRLSANNSFKSAFNFST